MPSLAASSGICRSTSGVRTNPGQITLERTPCGAPSLATTRHRPSRPCLATAYGPFFTDASFECTEPVNRIVPPRFCAYMCRRHARVVRNAPSRWIARSRFQFANEKSTISSKCWIPALLTRMSMPPSDAAAASTPRCTSLFVGDVHAQGDHRSRASAEVRGEALAPRRDRCRPRTPPPLPRRTPARSLRRFRSRRRSRWPICPAVA